MNYTENYQLPQWEETDRVLREDFNKMMGQLDQALHNKSPFSFLREFNVTETTSELIVDVSDIAWESWQYVMLDIQFRGSGYMLLQPNNQANQIFTYSSRVEYTNSIAGAIHSFSEIYDTRITFNCYKMPWRHIRTCVEDQQGCHFGGSWEISYQQLTQLRFIAENESSYLSAGSKILFWGVA